MPLLTLMSMYRRRNVVSNKTNEASDRPSAELIGSRDADTQLIAHRLVQTAISTPVSRSVAMLAEHLHGICRHSLFIAGYTRCLTSAGKRLLGASDLVGHIRPHLHRDRRPVSVIHSQHVPMLSRCGLPAGKHTRTRSSGAHRLALCNCVCPCCQSRTQQRGGHSSTNYGR
jgi:hypothetical protein